MCAQPYLKGFNILKTNINDKYRTEYQTDRPPLDFTGGKGDAVE